MLYITDNYTGCCEDTDNYTDFCVLQITMLDSMYYRLLYWILCITDYFTGFCVLQITLLDSVYYR